MTDRVPIYCRGCEKKIGEVHKGTDEQIAEESKDLREELEGKCPFCGRELWSESKKLEPPVHGIDLRFLT